MSAYLVAGKADAQKTTVVSAAMYGSFFMIKPPKYINRLTL